MKRLVSGITFTLLLLVAFAFPTNPAYASTQIFSLNSALLDVKNVSVVWIIDTPNYKEGYGKVELKSNAFEFYFKINITESCKETYYSITLQDSSGSEINLVASIPDTLHDAPCGLTVEAWRLDIPKWVLDILIPILLVSVIVLVICLVYDVLKCVLTVDLIDFFTGLGVFAWHSIPWVLLSLCNDRNPDGSLTLYFPYAPTDYVLSFLAQFKYPIATEYSWWLIVKKSCSFLWFTIEWFEAIWSYSRIASPPYVNISPSASFTYYPEAPFIGGNITFISTSFDPDGYIVNYHWNFGDGYEAEGNITTHQYLTAGTYNVTLEVRDNKGSAAIASSLLVIILAAIQIDPQSLNLRSCGTWVTTYIELPEGYDVANIDVTTIMLNGTIPAELEPAIIGDYDGDGIPDLKVYFNRTQLIKYVLSKGIGYGNVTLTISGMLYDGTLFEGSATIKVSGLAGDVNCDGMVDIFDIVAAAVSYDSKEDEPNWNPNANYAPPWNEIDIYDLATIASHYGKTHP